VELNEQIWWYTARAGGIVAWFLLAAAVVWGLLAHTRVIEGRPKPAWVLDLHRFLGGLAVVFTAVHVLALVADSYLYFGWSEVLVPFASAWEPGPVALGVVALWLLAAVEVSSLLQRRLPRRAWRWIHLSSYVAFWATALHVVLAGTDAANPFFVVGNLAAILSVTFLTAVRALGGRAARKRRPRPAAPTTDRTREGASS